jgi:hypothetical protein
VNERDLIAAATAATHAAATSECLAGEPDVFGDGIREAIAVASHEIVREVATFPRLDVGARAQAEARDAEDEFEQFHQVVVWS